MEPNNSVANKPEKLFWITCVYVVLLVLIIGGLSIVLWNYRGSLTIMFVPVYILQWGFVGGMIAVLYRLAIQPGDTPKVELYSWAVAKPIVGTVMGGFVYFLALSGQLFLNGNVEIQNVHFLNVLAFIGGFSDRYSIVLIDRLVSKSSGKQGEKPEGEQD